MEQLKILHITCVALSFTGFFIRGIWMLQDSVFLQNKWVKIVPHIVDAILLTTALSMLYVGHISVLEHSWLVAKILALLVYIGLGVYALKRGKTKRIRLFFWLAGLLLFMYIVSVAITKSVTGFM